MTIAIMKLWQNGRNAKGVARRTLRPERLSADGKQKSRTEQQIAEEVRRLASESVRINARQLEICIRQGECLMEAADFIRAAGGVEQWLDAHAIDLGIGGTSRTTAANLLLIARAGLPICKSAMEFAEDHPERLATNRRHGLDFFVAALRAYSDRQTLPKTKPVRLEKADREDILRRQVGWLDDLLHRAVAELERAVAGGWRPNVLNAIKAEMSGTEISSPVDTRGVAKPERRAARAEHHIASGTRGRQPTTVRPHKQPTLRGRQHTKAAVSVIDAPAKAARR